MMTTTRRFHADEICHTAAPSGFLMPAPFLVHAERIPVDIRSAMQGTWDRRWFPARPQRVAELTDVVVAIEGLVFTRELELIVESATQHSAEDIEEGRRMAAEAFADSTRPVIAGPIVLARKRGASNYGHFLAEMLPKAWVARKLLSGPLGVLVQDVGGTLDQVMREALEQAGFAPEQIVSAGREAVRVERLVMVDGLTEHGSYMAPVVMESLDDITSGIAPAGAEKLLVLRSEGSTRRLDEEEDVIAAAERGGFACVTPDRMPWREQVAAFKAARCIVGVMGAGLSNLMFTQAGASVTILAPENMPDTFFWFIAGLRGLVNVEVRCHLKPPVTGPAAWDQTVILDRDDRGRLFSPAWTEATPRAAPDWRETTRRLDHVFDDEAYRADVPGLASAGIDPRTHYITFGWREGRDPSKHFSTARSLAAYPGAVEAGLCPLLYGLLHGGPDAEVGLAP